MSRSDEVVQLLSYDKVSLLKKDLFSYIDQNAQKIDANLPVFFGHVLSSLERSFPGIDDTTHDEFIDAIAFRVLEASPRAGSIEVIERIVQNAIRSKRNGRGKGTLDILAGLKLMTVGKYSEAAAMLRPYVKYDVRIGLYIAYCYVMLSRQEHRKLSDTGKTRPSEMELAAREQLLEVLRTKPPANRLSHLDIRENAFLEDAYWAILGRAFAWFPTEPWFLEIGLEKAKKDKNHEMREKLLKIANERFFNDMFFLRELYAMRLEQKDGAGTAGVVRQMEQQYPDSSEPVYFGLKLALLSGSRTSFLQYRQKAVQAGIPVHLIYLFDFAFALFTNEAADAAATLREMKGRFASLKYYLTLIEVLLQDALSGDEARARTAKKAFFDSLESYTFQILKIKD